MTQQDFEQALAAAKLETRTLADQLRQARCDLHLLGISDQNRALVFSAVAGALGVLVGVGIGVRLQRK